MKNKFLCLIVVFTAAVGMYRAVSFANQVTESPCTHGTYCKIQNIGSWTDEYWEAHGFYMLKPESDTGSSAKFVYSYSNMATVLSRALTPYLRENTGASGSSAAVQPDVVVVEWNVTGHIHFYSGL